MKLFLAPVLCILFISAASNAGATVSCYGTESVNGHLEKHFKVPVVSPAAYIVYQRELQLAEPTIARDLWKLQLPTIIPKDARFYLPLASKGKILYKSAEAFLDAENSVAKNIRVQTAQIDFKMGNELLVADIKFIDIPQNLADRTITIKLERVVEDDIFQKDEMLEYCLPTNATTLNAAFTVFTEEKSGKEISYESEGFEISKTKNSNVIKYEFKYNSEYTLKDIGSIQPILGVRIANKTWLEVAELHWSGYEREVSKAEVLDTDALNVLFPLITGANNENVRDVAYETFRQIGEKIRYQSAILSEVYRSSYSPGTLSEIIRTRRANCTDYVLLYMKLLGRYGIKVEPVEVLINADSSADTITSKLPRNLLFNHVVAYLPEIDEYIDLTQSSIDVVSGLSFNYASSQFAGTIGLFLGSKELRVIKPELENSLLKVNTIVTKSGADWIGETVISGKGESYALISLIAHGRQKREIAGKKYEFPFSSLGYKEIANTWKFDLNPRFGEASLRLGFTLGKPTVADDDLVNVPVGFMSSILYPYEKSTTDKAVNKCFEKLSFEENLLLPKNSRISKSLYGSDFSIEGANTYFTQRISVDDQTLTVTRNLIQNERRAHCSEQHTFDKRDFFKNIADKINHFRGS